MTRVEGQSTLSAGDRSLRDLQLWFQAVITSPGGVSAGLRSDQARSTHDVEPETLEAIITSSNRLSAERRLGVYANAYHARLLECMREFFPVLEKTLGSDLFDDFAFEYLQRYPSRSFTLDRLGDRFSEFLAETRPDRDADGNAPKTPSWPDFLIDLVRMENAIAEVFDGPGIENGRILTEDDLSALTPQTFGNVGFETAACLNLIELSFPLNDYYSAVRHSSEDDPAPPMPAPVPQYLAITRRDFVVRRYELTPPQYRLLSALRENATIAEAISHGLSGDEIPADLPEKLSGWFRDWTAAGCFFVRVTKR